MTGSPAKVPDGPILVLGASGQIGRCLLRRLAAAGRPAVAVCRRPMPALAPEAEWLAHDLTRPLDMGNRRPVAAVHATGAWLLLPHLPALAAAGVERLVCFSSSSVLAKADSSSRVERETARRLSEVEAAVAASAFAWTVLRPAMVYGLGMDRNVSAAARFIRRWRWFPLAGPGGGLRQPVHADDLAAAATALVVGEAVIGGRFAVGGGETLSYRAMIERIFHVLDLPPRFLRLPVLAHLPGRMGATAARMEQDLAFDRGELWPRLGLAPRKFLAGGRRNLGA
jgi:nucleoside-diphosphate-sugar epimerase